jgi:hypothetical protein
MVVYAADLLSVYKQKERLCLQKKGCDCCLPYFFHEQKKGCVCCWAFFRP